MALDLAGDIFVLSEGTSSTNSTTGTTTTTNAAILELRANANSSGCNGGSEGGGGSQLSTLATFLAGASPTGQLAIDAAGDLFAVSPTDGANSDGAIYELPAHSGNNINQIASFGPVDLAPQGDLIADASGDLFGTTFDALSTQQSLSTVFELSAGDASIRTRLLDSSFTGSHIEPGIARDSAGNLYGAMVQSTSSATLFKIPADEDASDILNTFAQINGAPALASNGWLYASTTNLLYALPNAAVASSPKNLALMTAPTATDALATIAPISVGIVDSNNNIISADNAPISVRISKGLAGATLSGTLTVNASSGVATFDDLSINTPGKYKLSFSQSSLKKNLLVPIKITGSALDGSHLVITQSPASVAAGQSIPLITVTAQNSSNAISTTTKGKVSLTIGEITKTASLQNGIANFHNIKLDEAGQLEVRATTSASVAAQSVPLTVTPAAAKKLIFSEQPPPIVAKGVAFASQITLVDRFGNAVTSDTSVIDIGLSGKSSLLLLTGTLSQNLSDGMASFNDLVVNEPGNYKLAATDASDDLQVISAPFTIAAHGQSPGGS